MAPLFGICAPDHHKLDGNEIPFLADLQARQLRMVKFSPLHVAVVFLDNLQYGVVHLGCFESGPRSCW